MFHNTSLSRGIWCATIRVGRVPYLGPASPLVELVSCDGLVRSLCFFCSLLRPSSHWNNPPPQQQFSDTRGVTLQETNSRNRIDTYYISSLLSSPAPAGSFLHMLLRPRPAPPCWITTSSITKAPFRTSSRLRPKLNRPSTSPRRLHLRLLTTASIRNMATLGAEVADKKHKVTVIGSGNWYVRAPMA